MKRGFSTEQTFNKIYVAESLPDGELSTGIQLARDTLKLLCDVNEVAMDACNIGDKQSFFAFMKRVELQTRDQGVFPIIHLDIHGDEFGLQLSSDERVAWCALSDICRLINNHCSNNLLVILAVCHGFDLVYRTTITKLTPFCCLVGPTDDILVGQMRRGFPKFYRELFCSGELDSAFSLLGDPYELYLCENVFGANAINYIQTQCRGTGREKRVEDLLTEVRRSPTGRLIATSCARRKIKELIKPDAGKLERYRIKFLMADHPKNEGRFKLSIDEIIELAYEN